MRVRRFQTMTQALLCQGRGWRSRSSIVAGTVTPQPHASPFEQAVSERVNEFGAWMFAVAAAVYRLAARAEARAPFA